MKLDRSVRFAAIAFAAGALVSGLAALKSSATERGTREAFVCQRAGNEADIAQFLNGRCDPDKAPFALSHPSYIVCCVAR